MVKIAVLMSTYNGEKYIREQIDSILNQIGDFSLDLYVRDDGSTDNTLRLLEKYKAQNKLNWYTGENLKPAKSFIHLLKKCGTYDYYAFADQDDFWKQDKILRGINKLKFQNGPALYCSNAELVDDKLNTLNRNVYKASPKTDFETVVCAGGLLGCTMIFNNELAEVIKKYKNYPQMILHDFYLAVLCVSLGGKIIYDSQSTMKYRQHRNNVVGVSHGIIRTILSRIKDVAYKEPIGISNQAYSVLIRHEKDLSPERKKWLMKVAHYKDSVINRLKLACSHRTKYINKNMGIKLRISILLGNR